MHFEVKDTFDAANGTSLKGYVRATYEEMREAFGIAHRGHDGKTRANWVIDFGGTIATVYDWKRSEPLYQVRTWNIGGHDPIVVDLVREEIEIARYRLHDEAMACR